MPAKRFLQFPQAQTINLQSVLRIPYLFLYFCFYIYDLIFMKNYWAFVFCSFLLTSCNFVQKELPDSQELLRRELHTIDWSKVDTYPTYDSCEKFTDAEENKRCFFDRLNFEVENVLRTDSLVKLSTIDSVQFLVSLSP